jgi:hypothetical protein
MQECDGRGNCLQQTIDALIYDKVPDFPCKYDCKPIPCPNETICGNWGPKWYIELKRSGVCICCDSMFKKIMSVVESAECPMCLETTKCVIQPNCSHPTCIQCFKRCMYGEPDYPAPEFPYSKEIEDEWENDLDNDTNPKWENEYPLIEKWRADYDEWDRKKDLKYYKEENLRVCPLCRK